MGRLGLALDASGDIVVEEDEYGNKSPRTITGAEYAATCVRVRLGTILGEDQLHPEMGLAVNRLIGPFDETQIVGETIRAVLPDPEIQSVDDVEVTLDRATRSADAVIRATSVDANTAIVTEGGLF